MLPLPAILLVGERYLMLGVFFLGVLAVARIFRKLPSKPAVIIGLIALCAIELVYRIRPSFTHPQNRTDYWASMFAILLSLPLGFGLGWPLCKVTDNLCDAKRRSAYIRGPIVSDLFWFAMILLAVCLSLKVGWLL
jgi:hypothetical protein